MKVAIVGSRNLFVDNLEKYIPPETDEIVSGGARGIDKCAEKYARKNNLKLTVFLPDYDKYGKVAPIKRNLEIVNYAECVVALWDGKSTGTKNVIDICKKLGKTFYIVIL